MAIIDPERYYSPRGLICMRILPWRNAVTFTKRLKEESWRKVFNPIIERQKNKTVIHIKGENIIKFLELAANGQLTFIDEKD